MVRYRDQQMTGFSLIMPLHQDCRRKAPILSNIGGPDTIQDQSTSSCSHLSNRQKREAKEPRKKAEIFRIMRSAGQKCIFKLLFLDTEKDRWHHSPADPEFFHVFPSFVRHMSGHTSQRRGTVRILPN
jgi:hypothetical protein